MAKLSKSMCDCLTYYRDNEHNPDRLQKPPYTWDRRQMNGALERDWLCVGPGGWHILTEAGRAALASTKEESR
ncbi:MAG TPA: hypothetical protein VGV39_30065 [Mesorhizobium sp.]|jgi:hypothetical protein|uniref:hypothetical protein n=1 Tax=Mesorhizobium sp. TaxID=1871066 RepID=UPI002DDD4770|nr:hypothetical protein [Mesorhizobium sp.]HEV2507356.1 hypothetical protein [Mesorhizobium sp.]